MYRAVRLVVVVLFASLATAALAADPNKVWHGVLSDDPPGFDPAGPTSASAAQVFELIFERLYTYDYLARPAKIVPMAAEAMPESSDGGRTWTVRIRRGILFAPDSAFKGARRELVAQDFVYAFMRFMDPRRNSPYEFMFRDRFVGLDELRAAAQKGGRFDYDAKLEGLQALDRYTLRFRLHKPDPRFVYVLAHGSAGAVAREVVDAYGANIDVHPVGTGPYMLTAWTPGTKAVLTANPNYRGYVWDFAPGDDPRDAQIVREMRGKSMPQIGRLELSVIEEDAAYWLAFLRGDVDVAALLPRFQAASMSGADLNADLKAKGLSMYRVATPSITFTSFNFRDPVVGGFEREKIALRRAIAMAYNGDDEINVLLHGNAERAQMPIPPGVVGYDRNYRSSILYDPDLANKLLDRFGYKRGADGFRRLPDGRPLTLVRNTTAGTFFRDMDNIWDTSMRRIGIRMTFKTMTPAETYKASTTCTIALFTNGWLADYPDGENFMQLFYGPNSGQSNNGCYRSAAYDTLYDKAAALPDGVERDVLFLEMSRQLEADTAVVLGAYARAIIVQQPWVQGHKRHPILNTVLPFVDLKPH